MKSRFVLLAFLCCLAIWSCQKEEAPIQLADNTEENATERNQRLGVFCVLWGNNPDDPVEGAVVFNAETNELIGRTDADGILCIFPDRPTVYRVVDPYYGRQQAEVRFPEDFVFDGSKKGKTIIGWSLDGKPIWG